MPANTETGPSLIELIILLTFQYAVGIAYLVMASKYQHEIVCESSIDISLYAWMITQGVLCLLCGSCAPAVEKGDDLISLFSLIWLIIGSVIFWRDCPDCDPQEINQFLYVTLIINYVVIGLSIQAGVRKR